MKKILFALLIVQSIVWGYTYNDLLVKAQAALFPKILLLDRNLPDKLVNGHVVYLIAYEENDLGTAREISRYIAEAFSGKLDDYVLDVILMPFADITPSVEATAIYTLNSETSIPMVSDVAKSKRITTFAYDTANLKQGILFSLMVEKTTVLYLARHRLPEYRVEFVDALYQIVRFMNE